MYLTLLFSLFFSSPSEQPVILDGIAAVVGGDIILISEVKTNIIPNLPKICALPAAKKSRVLKQVWRMSLETEIGKALLKLEAKKHNIFVGAYRINLAIRELMRKNGISSITELKKRLAADGISYEILRNNIKFQLLKSRLMADLVDIKVNVDDEAVKSYYLQKLREVKAEAKVSVREIFIPKKFKNKTASIKKELASKVPFKVVADKYAVNGITSSVKLDITPGIYNPSVNSVLFPRNKSKEPKAGSIIGPVESEKGYYFLFIIDRQKSAYLPFEEVKAKLKNQLIARKMQKKSEEWLKSLRKKYLVDVHVPFLPVTSFCK